MSESQIRHMEGWIMSDQQDIQNKADVVLSQEAVTGPAQSESQSSGKKKRPKWVVAVELAVCVTLFSGAILILLFQKGGVVYFGGTFGGVSSYGDLQTALHERDLNSIQDFVKQMLREEPETKNRMAMEMSTLSSPFTQDQEGVQLISGCLTELLPKQKSIPYGMEDVYSSAIPIIVLYQEQTVSKPYCEMLLNTTEFNAPKGVTDIQVWRKVISSIHRSKNRTGDTPEELLKIIDTFTQKLLSTKEPEKQSKQIGASVGMATALFVACEDTKRVKATVNQIQDYAKSLPVENNKITGFVNQLNDCFGNQAPNSNQIDLLIQVLESVSKDMDQEDIDQIAKWTWKFEPHERIALYKKIPGNSDVARLVAQSFLTIPQGEPLNDVVASYLDLIQYDVEVGRSSAAFDHLLDYLNQKKMVSQARELARFFWNTFPQSQIGQQAFWAWVRNGSTTSHRGEVVSVMQDQRAWWDGSPMTASLLTTNVWLDMQSGQTLQAVVQIVSMSTGKGVDPQVMLTDELVMQWLSEAKQWCARNHYDIKPEELHFNVADQIQSLNEYSLAGVLFWRLCQQAQKLPLNPLTDAAYEADFAMSNSLDPAMSDYFKSQAMQVVGRNEDAGKVLHSVATNYPESLFAQIAHLELAETAMKTKKFDQAKQQIQALGEDFSQTKRAKRVLKQLEAQEAKQPKKTAG